MLTLMDTVVRMVGKLYVYTCVLFTHSYWTAMFAEIKRIVI